MEIGEGLIWFGGYWLSLLVIGVACQQRESDRTKEEEAKASMFAAFVLWTPFCILALGLRFIWNV